MKTKTKIKSSAQQMTLYKIISELLNIEIQSKSKNHRSHTNKHHIFRNKLFSFSSLCFIKNALNTNYLFTHSLVHKQN